MQRYIISITGNTATGTTTLARRLGQLAGWRPVYSEEYLNQSPFFAKFLHDPRRWAFHNQSFFIAEYITMYQTETTRTRPENHILCLDYTVFELEIYTDAMTRMRFLACDERRIIDRYFSLLKPQLILPNLLIYLTADIDVLMRRIKNRDRLAERCIDMHYVKALQASFDHFVATWKESPILIINSQEANFFNDETIKVIADNVLAKMHPSSAD